MFEKEAEEYVQEIETDDCVVILNRKERKMDFQNGAEFGYNKANEWHRLGKNPNDLPDEDVPVLCVRGGNGYVEDEEENRKPTKLEEWIDGITQIADPCKMCAYINKNGESHFQNTEVCKGCCWYYPSEFKERKK